MKAIIFGDSLVSQLSSSRHSELLQFEEVELQIQGHPGLKIADDRFPSTKHSEILVLALGGNDWQRSPGMYDSRSPKEMVADIENWIKKYRRQSLTTTTIIVMEILPRYSSWKRSKYSMTQAVAGKFQTWAEEVNAEMRLRWGTGDDNIWLYNSQKFSDRRKFSEFVSDDGVHFSDKGLYWWSKDLRFALSLGLKRHRDITTA